jgi:hypothetical protein
LVASDLGDADEQRAEDPLAAVLIDGGAVPDVSLARARPDLELELADPFRACRKPAVAAQGAVDPHRKAAASSRETRRDEVAVGAHHRDEWCSPLRVDLLDGEQRRTRRRQVRRPQSASD